MSAESIGAYSPDTVYGQLTSPFIKKMVHINAHPSSEADKNTSQTVSLKNFIPSKADARVDVSEISAAGAAKAKEIHEGNFPPDKDNADKVALTDFSSKKIVDGALKKGYTPKEAIVIKNAAVSYANVSKLGVAKMLSSHVHQS